jgi:hypothetical protein
MNTLNDLSSDGIQLPKKIATKIKKIDNYYGYLAWAQVLFAEKNKDKALEVLKEMTSLDSTRPEAYYKLWRYYYDNEMYPESENIAAKAFVKVTSVRYTHYFIIFCISYAKSYIKLGKTRGALELLQQKYIEHPKHAIFLYQYGKFCIKSNEDMYLVCGITALEESLRVCDVSLNGKILYWLGKAFAQNDYPVKAHTLLSKSYDLLGVFQPKKKSEIDSIKAGLNPLVSKLESIESIKTILKSDEIAKKIADTHPIEGLIAFAKSLWKIDKESSVGFLLGYKNSVTRCDYFFLMFSYMKVLKDYKSLKSESKELLKKSKELNIPTSDWIKCHIWQAKALAYCGRPEKAIFLLKCLSKVYPDIPYLEIKYTKNLGKAKTVEEILNTNSIDIDFKQSVHIVSNAYLDALAARAVPLFLQEKKDEAQIIYASDSVIDASVIESANVDYDPARFMRPTIERYNLKRPQLLENTNFASKKLEVLIETREKSGFAGFSLCSDPEFLMLIGKIAYKHQVEINDGLCALEDYLEIVNTTDQRLKATYYKAMLFYIKKSKHESKLLMTEIFPLLQNSEFFSKFNRIKDILNSLN